MRTGFKRGYVVASAFLIGIILCAWNLSNSQAQNATAAKLSGFRENVPTVSESDFAKIEAALPVRAQSKPKRARRLLVFTLARGYVHSSIPHGALAIQRMGQKTGAYSAVVSDDLAAFEAKNLQQFDAVCFLSTTGDVLQTATSRQAILNFVRNGGGVVGVHAATDSHNNWPEFGALMGGFFDGHPWNAGDTVTLRVEDRESPLCKHFPQETFTITDEIYQFREYSRQRQRVLLGLELSQTPRRDGMKRTDNDYPVSWIRREAKGRVFYSSLGHREDIYWNPLVLQHYLAGIQFALGDLSATTTPLPQPTSQKP